jgi:hypothetical protein
MTLRFLRFAILLPALLFAACATMPVREAFPVAARDKVASTEIVAPVKQNEIYVYVPPSQVAAAGGGGLLLALVDVAVDDIRTKKAEAAVKTLRDSLNGFNFDESFQNDLKAKLAQVSWVGVSDAHVIKDNAPGSLDQALVNSKAGAVLFATCDYHLSNDADVLTVQMTASLFPNNDALRMAKTKPSTASGPKTAFANALYYNSSLAFETKPPEATSDRDHNIATWSANDGAVMRTALKMATAKLAAMLADDLQRAEDMPPAVDPKDPSAVTVDGVKGQMISSDNDGEVVRFRDGTLKYATKSALQP